MNKKSFLVAGGVFLLLLVGLGVGLYLLQQQQELRKKAAPSTTLTITGKTVYVQDTFTIPISIDTAGNDARAAQLALNFDSSKLYLQEIKSGPFFPNVTQQPEIDNALGTAEVSYGTFAVSTGQQGVVANLTFQAKEAGSALVSFGPQTKITGKDGPTSRDLLVSSPSSSSITILSQAGFTQVPAGSPAASPTPEQTGSPSPSPTPSPAGGILSSPSPLASPNPEPVEGEGGSPTPTSTPAGGTGQLPTAGVSIPTLAALGAGALILLIGIVLAF